MAHLMENDDLRLRALSQDDLPLLEAWENDAEGWLSSNTINPLSKDFIQQYITTSSRHIMETGTMGTWCYTTTLPYTAVQALGSISPPSIDDRDMPQRALG